MSHKCWSIMIIWCPRGDLNPWGHRSTGVPAGTVDAAQGAFLRFAHSVGIAPGHTRNHPRRYQRGYHGMPAELAGCPITLLQDGPPHAQERSGGPRSGT
jgi:hypothetical protein